MFKEIAEKHEKEIREKRRRLKELENKIAYTTLPALSNAIFNELDRQSDLVVQNQKEIQKKCKSIHDNWEKFSNEVGRWENSILNLDKAIQEIGDVRSWALQIQHPVDDLCEKLDAK